MLPYVLNSGDENQGRAALEIRAMLTELFTTAMSGKLVYGYKTLGVYRINSTIVTHFVLYSNAVKGLCDISFALFF